MTIRDAVRRTQRVNGLVLGLLAMGWSTLNYADEQFHAGHWFEAGAVLLLGLWGLWSAYAVNDENNRRGRMLERVLHSHGVGD